MLKDYTEIGIILDCSGSMGCIKKAIVEGYNTFIETQKEIPGKCMVTLTKFADEVAMSEPRLLENVENMTLHSYKTNGMTALWKAIKETIDTMGKRFAKMKEEDRPEKVLVVIITDGEENASNGGSVMWGDNKKFITLESIKEKIEHQKDNYNWEFIFIGAETLDVKHMSASMGISRSVAFTQTDVGTKGAYSKLITATASYRSTGKILTIACYRIKNEFSIEK